MLPCEGITTFHQKRCGSLLHLQDLKFKNNNINVQILFVRKLIGYRITDGSLREGPLHCTQQNSLSLIHFPRRNLDANIETLSLTWEGMVITLTVRTVFFSNFF